jgi:hypothetical protein
MLSPLAAGLYAARESGASAAAEPTSRTLSEGPGVDVFSCNRMLVVCPSEMREVPHSSARKRSLQPPERTLMELTGATFIDMKGLANLPQRHFLRIPKTDHRPVTRRQSLQFLPDNRRSLLFERGTLRRTVPGCRNSVVRVGRVADLGLRQGVGTLSPCMAANQIQHFAPDSKLRVQGQRRTVVRFVSARGLKVAHVPGLNQVSHLDSATLRQSRMQLACQTPYNLTQLWRDLRSRCLQAHLLLRVSLHGLK